MFLPPAGVRLVWRPNLLRPSKLRPYNDLRVICAFDIRRVILAGQVLLSKVRKEAALDLHSPFSTSHNKPLRPPDRPLASPFLTFLPFASFELWPQKWGRFFWGVAQAWRRLKARKLAGAPLLAGKH
jgi:hypothetical protein